MLGKPQTLTKQVIRVLGTWSRRKESGFYSHLTRELQAYKLDFRIPGKPQTLTKQGSGLNGGGVRNDVHREEGRRGREEGRDIDFTHI